MLDSIVMGMFTALIFIVIMAFLFVLISIGTAGNDDDELGEEDDSGDTARKKQSKARSDQPD